MAVGVPAIFLLGLLACGRSEAIRFLPFSVRFCYLGVVFFLLVVVGGLRMRQEMEIAKREQSWSMTAGVVTVEGSFCSQKETQYSVDLLLEQCVVWREDQPMSLRFLLVSVKGEQLPKLEPGNQVRVTGSLKPFSQARNPGEFDQRGYYRSNKINSRISGSSCQVIGRDKNSYKSFLAQIKSRAAHTLNHIAGNDAGIFQAAVLGDRSQLDQEVKELYQRSGISHLLAISGLHVSLIGMGLYGVLRKAGAGFLKAGAAGAFLIVSYGVMAGGSSSVVRASLMLTCSFLAAYLGRTYDLLSALSLSGMLLLWDSPYLVTQAGFQLSFGAVLGIGILVPELERCFAKKKAPGLWRGFLVSLGIQMVTAPVILYHYFQIPLYGVLLNLIVLPFMGIVVASGVAGAILGSIYIPGGIFAIGAGRFVLVVYEELCRWFSLLPKSNLVWGRPSLWQVCLYYLILLVGIGWMRRQEQVKIRWLCMMAFLLCLLHPLPVSGLTVTFLDVGQGDGICLRTRAGTVLVDGGSNSVKGLGMHRLEPFLKSQGITEIVCAYVSHGDEDHISGLRELLQDSRDIVIKTLMLPALGREDPAYDQLVQLAQSRGTKVSWVKAGHGQQIGKLAITCLYPGAADSALDRNAQSLVLGVAYDDFHLLLTGDMGADQEMVLTNRSGMRELLNQVQVLKIAHHGSRYSTSQEWLEHWRPVWAVISSGEHNSYGHPHQEVLDRLEQKGVRIYKTAVQGAVWLQTDGKNIRWKSYLCFRP